MKNTKLNLTKEFLINNLIIQNKQIKDLAKELGCNIKTIWRYNQKYNIVKPRKHQYCRLFKGRIYDKDGYVLIYHPFHPNAGRGKCYILEHRLVMEKKLGRYLLPEEIVHHINNIRDDNRIENLELMTPSEHQKFHYKNDNRVDKKTGRFL